MPVKRLVVVIAACALAGNAFAQEEKKSEKPSAEKKSDKAPGSLPRKAKAKDEHHHQATPAPRADEPQSDMAKMSRTPPPTTGSMPKGPAPKGKLGTEPTAKGKLGTDPKPDESSKPPPRLN